MKSQDESNEQRASFEGKLRFEWRGIVQRLKEPIFYGRFRVESGVCSLFGCGSMVLNESIQKNISWGLVCRLKYVLADEPRFKNVYSIIGATSVARYFNRPLLFHRPCTEINPSTVVKKLCRYPLPRNVLAGTLGACRLFVFLRNVFVVLWSLYLVELLDRFISFEVSPGLRLLKYTRNANSYVFWNSFVSRSIPEAFGSFSARNNFTDRSRDLRR